jgi:hypothetical protein
MELTLSPKSTKKSTSFQDKFEKDNVAQFMGGDYSFTSTVGKKGTKKKGKTVRSKAKEVTNKATKISPLEQPDGMTDMLSKILTFMQKTNEDDQKARELLNNYQEENAIEADKRHKALLEALNNIKLNSKNKKEETADKLEQEANQSGSSLVGDIIDAVPDIDKSSGKKNVPKTKKSWLSKLAKFKGLIPLTVFLELMLFTPEGMSDEEQTALLEKAAGKGFTPDDPNKPLGTTNEQIKNSKEAKRIALEKSNASLMLKTFGSDKEQKDYLKRQGVPNDELDRMFPELAPSKPKSIEPAVKPPNQEQSRLQQLHKISMASGSSAMSTPVAQNNNLGTKLNDISSENAILPLIEDAKEEIITNVNNTVNPGGDSETSTIQELPFVRNQEPTFMRMIYQSTRVV